MATRRSLTNTTSNSGVMYGQQSSGDLHENSPINSINTSHNAATTKKYDDELNVGGGGTMGERIILNDGYMVTGSSDGLVANNDVVTSVGGVATNYTNHRISWFIVQITVIASIGGILFGYDLGVISGALPQLSTTFTLTSQQQESAVSILYVGGGIGAAVGGTLCDSIGRKRTILVTDVVFVIGAIMLWIAPTFAWILIGRVVVGFGVAVSGIADVSYLHEIAPVHVRYVYCICTLLYFPRLPMF